MIEFYYKVEEKLTIRQFYLEEWKSYKKLRLDSLIESPNAFGSTFEKENNRSDFEWQERLIYGIKSKTDMPILALCSDQLSGLAWGKSEKKQLEVVNLYQMWVNPEFRSKGIGLALLKEIKKWAENLGSHSLNLGVTINNGKAYQIYKTFGFKQFGNTEPLREGSNLELQLMSLDLKNP
ncbi:MAG: GNAT family N-acetyltransferase [Thiohalomonadales bacterium]